MKTTMNHTDGHISIHVEHHRTPTTMKEKSCAAISSPRITSSRALDTLGSCSLMPSSGNHEENTKKKQEKTLSIHSIQNHKEKLNLKQSE